MSSHDPRTRFAELAALPDAELPLAEAALWIAAEECPGLDVGLYLARLDQLGRQAALAVPRAAGDVDRVVSLNAFLFEEEGFSGNRRHYEDPRNSFLNEVLDRRTGIPITLSTVYLEVAARIGLRVVGVSFPGHFLVKTRAYPEILIDPFFGCVLPLEECENRLRQMFGDEAVLEPEHLRAASTREILLRMLGNLKALYYRSDQMDRTLACIDRILLLAPERIVELRDRAGVYLRLECFGRALADLERFVECSPDPRTAIELQSALEHLREQVRHIH